MKTKQVEVRLVTRGKAVDLKPGEKVPEDEVFKSPRYKIEMPDADYEKLKAEAKRKGTTIERLIFSKYKHPDELPSNWIATRI